jgi:integrase
MRPYALLTVKDCEKCAEEGGIACDGGGLYLRSTPPYQASWLFRYRFNGKSRWTGIGGWPTVSLKLARARAEELRKLVASGIDPVAQKQTTKAAQKLEEARRVSFQQAAEKYISAHQNEWKNPKHRGQWRSTLETYAFPIIANLPVADVDTAMVLKCLEPIWNGKRETATRLRGRIEKVLGWATVAGLRTGLNPARWKDNLDHLLANDERKIEHHAALNYNELPAFMAKLRKNDAMAARGLEFTILTAGRTQEAIGAKWEEVDFTNKVWTVPAERMKSKVEHKVPLSDSAIELLKSVQGRDDVYVFPGQNAGKPLSNMAFLMLLRRMGHDDLTAHGFRSTFSDWARDKTNFPPDIVEAALAHAIRDKAEKAYRRGTALEKRGRLMQAWSDYSVSTPVAKADNVVSIGVAS